ncbi:hypothetical protein pneo_cds_645 [Pandoravirus neocaledonia]|uniref:Uncharacterized protein n=1 Tax=Pandoravirus neocaledonia TaxID=2107708 RepID=A0A2U7UCX7_9VIRU|nr:hypothetical protein pneo_cds_645 [Pandoravirus neocaledonia]AVK76252.1 hypothetical protein pneo_cds_645 [Pandoravirus neocaledonia]
MHSRRIRWPRTPTPTTEKRPHGRFSALAGACLCAYSGAALMAAALHMLCWVVRGVVDPLATWHGRDRLWNDMHPASPGSRDDESLGDEYHIWSARSLWTLATYAAGMLWPLWAAARMIARRRRVPRPSSS